MPPERVSVIVLTRGDRDAQLVELLRSVRRQRSVEAQVVVVRNGGLELSTTAASLADRIVALPDNVGIPAGRNRGAEQADHPVLVFLDDDGRLEGDDALARVVAPFVDERVAVVGMRIVDEHGVTARRHVPRVGRRGADRAGVVTSFLGGAVAIDAAAFRDVGGYDERFWYAMEETDLAWRLVARGRLIRYEPGARLIHPATAPSRHADHVGQTARNRVWAAFGSLPYPLPYVYVATWTIVSSIRQRSPGAVLAGVRRAWPSRSDRRAPMSWAAVGRLSRWGRPPVI